MDSTKWTPSDFQLCHRLYIVASFWEKHNYYSQGGSRRLVDPIKQAGVLELCSVIDSVKMQDTKPLDSRALQIHPRIQARVQGSFRPAIPALPT